MPVGVHALFVREGRILLMRRAGTGFFDGMHSLPGGHVEADESVYAAATRESAEELGVAVDAWRMLGVVHRRSDTNRVDFFLRAEDWGGEPEIREPHKCDELLWCDPGCLPATLVPYVKEALALPQAAPWILELGW